MHSEGAGYFDVRSERAFNDCEAMEMKIMYKLLIEVFETSIRVLWGFKVPKNS